MLGIFVFFVIFEFVYFVYDLGCQIVDQIVQCFFLWQIFVNCVVFFQIVLVVDGYCCVGYFVGDDVCVDCLFVEVDVGGDWVVFFGFVGFDLLDVDCMVDVECFGELGGVVYLGFVVVVGCLVYGVCIWIYGDFDDFVQFGMLGVYFE